MTKGYDKNKIQFALVNDKITHIKDITKGDIVICLECGEELIIRDGTKNIKHLAHSCDTECKYHRDIEHCNESYQHKYVKIYIKENAQTFKKLDAFQENSREIKIIDSTVEYTKLKQELNLESMYIPDVLLLTAEGYICLEIYKTNKKDTEHIKNVLYPRNIQVYEIDINNIDISDFNMNDIYNNIELIYDANLIAHEEKVNEIVKLTESNLRNEFTEKFHKRIEEVRQEFLKIEDGMQEEYFNSLYARKIKNMKMLVQALSKKSFDKFRSTIRQDIREANSEVNKIMLGSILKRYDTEVHIFLNTLELWNFEKILRVHKIYYEKRWLIAVNTNLEHGLKTQENILKELSNTLNFTVFKELTELKKLLK